MNPAKTNMCFMLQIPFVRKEYLTLSGYDETLNRAKYLLYLTLFIIFIKKKSNPPSYGNVENKIIQQKQMSALYINYTIIVCERSTQGYIDLLSAVFLYTFENIV